MDEILISGLINFETTLRVDHFPVEYSPVLYPFHGIRSTISGVGYNLTKALKTLGHNPYLLSLVGRDTAGALVYQALLHDGLCPDHVCQTLDQTAQSVILYDSQGKRQIHVDLKDIQNHAYPVDLFARLLPSCRLAILCNINFSRTLLGIARQAGVPVATDVHAISDLDDPYNMDFMAQADILFMSDENLSVSPQEWASAIMKKYRPKIIVIGMGSSGALLGLAANSSLMIIPAVTTRPVINTIGAGDALFASFIHCYLQSADPYLALQKAVVFASYKIGETGASDGFIDAETLDRLVDKVYTE
jgi:ribokinase